VKKLTQRLGKRDIVSNIWTNIEQIEETLVRESTYATGVGKKKTTILCRRGELRELIRRMEADEKKSAWGERTNMQKQSD